MISRSEATLVVASGILLGLLLLVRPPSGRAFEGELVGVVENAVEDGIGEGVAQAAAEARATRGALPATPEARVVSRVQQFPEAPVPRECWAREARGVLGVQRPAPEVRPAPQARLAALEARPAQGVRWAAAAGTTSAEGAMGSSGGASSSGGVTDGTALTLTTTSCPAATQGQAYTCTLAAFGGTKSVYVLSQRLLLLCAAPRGDVAEQLDGRDLQLPRRWPSFDERIARVVLTAALGEIRPAKTAFAFSSLAA